MASQMNVGFDVETSDGNAKAAAIRIGNMIFSSFLRSVVSSFAQSIFLSELDHMGSFESQKTSKLKTGPNQHNVISSKKLDPNLNIRNSHSNAQRNFKSMIFFRYFINLLISISDILKMAPPPLIFE